jgi:hypothetical protein
MKDKLNSEFRRLRTMSLPFFLGYFVLVGGLAGLGAWVLVLGLAAVFGMNTPTLPSLLFAIPRGSLFAVILGLALRWYWNRSR